MGETTRNKKGANGLVALSSAAIMAVYGAGYARTRDAANRYTAHTTERRPHVPIRRERTAPAATDVVATARHVGAPTAPPAPRVTETAARETTPATKSTTRPSSRSESPRAAHTTDPTTPPAKPTQAAEATQSTEAAQATEAIQATQSSVAPATPSASKYRDGTYLGWGTSPHGDIQAAVIIEGGRITTAKVAQCLTRYSCAWVAPIPPVIIEQQSTTYDYVSGATESSDAFQNAVADALSHAL